MKTPKIRFGGTSDRNTKRQSSGKPGKTWDTCKAIALKELSNKRLFVVDAFCGANADTRMAIRFIVEVAWLGSFCKEYVYSADRGRA